MILPKFRFFRSKRVYHGPRSWPWWKLVSFRLVKLSVQAPSTGYGVWAYTRWGAACVDIYFPRRSKRFIVAKRDAQFVFSLNDLIKAFGSGPQFEVPFSANAAYVNAWKGEPVEIQWTCILTREIASALSPELAALDAEQK